MIYTNFVPTSSIHITSELEEAGRELKKGTNLDGNNVTNKENDSLILARGDIFDCKVGEEKSKAPT